MAKKTIRKSNPANTRSTPSNKITKQNIRVKQATKKKLWQQCSKDRLERVREALNRDADLLYNAMENPPTSMFALQPDSVVYLAESMRDIGG